ncbi:MAG: polysaccharide pyruvyl transferase family protein, partial [Ignavibacteriae bacterium]|nr:polysaccharide pyruvyl transferase family protein [Ignavibacteriota bacterium]
MIKIGHFGTFDVDNYGDLLFPYIAEYRLPKYDWEHISPTNNTTVFKDSLPVVSFAEAMKKKYNAVVIGGGNILHLNHNKNTVYSNIDGFAYANLWVGAAKIAMEQNVPYIFNAPGVSKKIRGYFHEKIAQYTFENSNYVALREKYSLDLARRVIKNTR